jgi:hypothetical protein
MSRSDRGVWVWTDTDLLGGELKLSVSIFCNKVLQPFADADKLQFYNTLCFPFSFLKKEMSRSDRGIFSLYPFKLRL